MIMNSRSRPDASQYLQEKWGLSYAPSTLANPAVTGEGPPYRIAGRHAVYADPDLDAWAQSRISDLMRKSSHAVEDHAA
jgi:hypothetical protein